MSEQHYHGVNLQVKIKKEQGTISDILLTISTKEELEIQQFNVELITKKREINHYDLKLIDNSINLPHKLNSSTSYELDLNFAEFKNLLSEGELPFRTFRFVIKTSSNKAYKSHELGFNKRWIIYRPDSGTYN
jgi:hypothetical protein